MGSRILLFDIGNTSIKVGLADREKLLTTYTLGTKDVQTSDALGLTLYSLLQHAGVKAADLEACVGSSVVPALEPVLREACHRYAALELLLAPLDIPVPLENRYANPHEVGADRLVGAYAARRLFPDPASIISVDFGTATTFDCISGQAYLGGLIFPGVQTAAHALASHAAKLPPVSLDVTVDEPAPCRDTVTSMNHGIIFGFGCMVAGLTARLARQLPGPVCLVATGGFAPAIARVSACFDQVFPDLLLDGLRRLYLEQC